MKKSIIALLMTVFIVFIFLVGCSNSSQDNMNIKHTPIVSQTIPTGESISPKTTDNTESTGEPAEKAVSLQITFLASDGIPVQGGIITYIKTDNTTANIEIDKTGSFSVGEFPREQYITMKATDTSNQEIVSLRLYLHTANQTKVDTNTQGSVHLYAPDNIMSLNLVLTVKSKTQVTCNAIAGTSDPNAKNDSEDKSVEIDTSPDFED